MSQAFRRTSPKPQSQRTEQLRQAGMLLASPARQRAYWAHANRQPRRRGPLALSDSLTEMLAGGFGRTLRHAVRVGELLSAVLPSDVLPHVQIGPLHRGTLTLHVPSGAMAYHLDRRFAGLLVEACAEAAPELGIRQVRFAAGGAVS